MTEDEPKFTRRQFLFASSTGAVAGFLAALALRPVDPLLRLTESLVRDVVETHDTSLFAGIRGDLLRDLFLWTKDEPLTTVPGTQHPEWDANGHPADRLAQAFAANAVAVNEFLAANDYPLDSNPVLPADLTGDLAIFGSPVSNEVSAAVLGFQGSHPYSLNFIPTPVSMHLRWVPQIDEAASSGAQLLAWKGSAGKYSVPNWQVADVSRGTSAGTLIRNEAGLNDYLIITRIRNFLDPTAFKSGRTITIFGGAHGLGTVGFGTLSRDPALLHSLIRAIATDDAQILLEVKSPRKIEEPSVLARGLYDQYPTEVSIKDVEILRIPDAAYESARDDVVENLRRNFRKRQRDWQWLV